MAETLTSKISLNAILDNLSGLDLSSVKDPVNYKKIISLANGTGLDQADLVFHDQRTLAASATEDIDLAASLTNAFGTSLTFARIKAIIVFALLANTNNVEVGGAAANAFINWVGDATDVIVVRPGGLLMLVAPDATAYVVTAATGDLLKITNSAGGTGVTYDIIIVGAST